MIVVLSHLLGIVEVMRAMEGAFGWTGVLDGHLLVLRIGEVRLRRILSHPLRHQLRLI